MSSKQKWIEHKHPLAIRWNHWLNFPLLTIMLISGLAIYWANPVYFIPPSWIEAFGLNRRLALGLAWHFVCAHLFALNGLAYVIFLSVSGGWRDLAPNYQTLLRAPLVALHDLGLYSGPLPQAGKYNDAQKLAYLFVVLLGLGMTLTGFAIYKPVQLSPLVRLLGGYQAARYEHFIMTCLMVAFFIVHLLQVIRAGWNNFRAMISGLEEHDQPPTR